MKNQYFGDVRDWLKYALLRGVTRAGFGLTVGWMLTEDDHGTDGEVRWHWKSDRARAIDPELFDWFRGWQERGGTRDVRQLEESGLVPARFHSSLLHDDVARRDAWFSDLTETAASSEVVFLDPDNGLEVPSCRRGARRSSKYVYWQEVQALCAARHSVIVYQHLARVKREVYARQRLEESRAFMGAIPAFVVSAVGVEYFVFPRPEHAERLRNGIGVVAARSSGRLRLAGMTHDVEVSVVRPGAGDRVRRIARGKTTAVGSTNAHQQEVIARTELPGNDHGQRVYVLRCRGCRHEYGANGSNVSVRRCPACQGGVPGLPTGSSATEALHRPSEGTDEDRGWKARRGRY
jgi:hypothetical protein